MADGVEVAASPASPLAVLGSGSLAAYWRFHEAVTKAQLAAWLGGTRRLLIDISGPTASGAHMAAARGHTVIRVIPAHPGSPAADTGDGSEGHAGLGLGRWPVKPGHGTGKGAMKPGHGAGKPGRGWLAGDGMPTAGQGQIVPVLAEPGSLGFLADGCADGVIAEEGALSRHLMTEDLAAEIARVLRPGGELLACVDSLVLGMAILAEQRRWAHLVDLPHAEVVLIPWPDGTITRCFGAAQLNDMLAEAGLEVRWIRPRTVLSPSMVDHVLRQEPGAMARLVRAELQAGDEQPPGAMPEESFGIRLIAAACKAPAPRRGGRVTGPP
jgi:hypothetical protein